MKRPNIILILSDDHGAWALGCAGNNEIQTPNLDQLAKEGVRFSHFFCTSPVSSPARASILTGKMPSAHGIHDWIRRGSLDPSLLPDSVRNQKRYNEETGIDYLDEEILFTDILAEKGYRCGMVGKWHLGNSMMPQHGFKYWHALLRGGCNYYDGDVFDGTRYQEYDGYITDYFTDKALQFIEEGSGQNPFYLSVHYNAPHDPWGRDNHPSEFFNLYEDISGQSCPVNELHMNQIETDIIGDSEDKRLELIKGYYAAITAMDRGIGRLLNKVESCGIKEDTIIIFTSDNGMNLGHHGVWGKGNGTYPQNMYDSSIKVPFIFSWPRRIKGNRVSNKLRSHYDLQPTIFECVNIEDCNEHLPGSSFYEDLIGGYVDDKNAVVIYDEYGPTRMIRTERYKYVHRYLDGPHEFYDLELDPDEKINLLEHIKIPRECEEMKIELEQFFKTYSTSTYDGKNENVTGAGQIDKLTTNKDYRRFV